LQTFKSQRFRKFWFFMGVGFISYVSDCMIGSMFRSDLPWYERSIYAGPGLLFTVLILLCGVVVLMFENSHEQLE
jgi:hypothetical protein